MAITSRRQLQHYSRIHQLPPHWDDEQLEAVVSMFKAHGLMRGRTPENLKNWDFWVVPTRDLPNQKSIGLNRLKAKFGDPVSFERLRPVVDAQNAANG